MSGCSFSPRISSIPLFRRTSKQCVSMRLSLLIPFYSVPCDCLPSYFMFTSVSLLPFPQRRQPFREPLALKQKRGTVGGPALDLPLAHCQLDTLSSLSSISTLSLPTTPLGERVFLATPLLLASILKHCCTGWIFLSVKTLLFRGRRSKSHDRSCTATNKESANTMHMQLLL